ncbi:MAG: hypothetical protein J1E85_09630 [Ruminococcus sp.]|nr:hypothetical protein [Ruminococcus sp.]
MASTNIINQQIAEVKQTAAKSKKVKSLIFYFKLLMLYLLNVSDWLCTEALIASGRFYEANPIMQSVIDSFWMTLLVKGILPLVLVLLCAIIFRLADCEEGKFTGWAINFGIIVYSLLNIWHIANFVLLFSLF